MTTESNNNKQLLVLSRNAPTEAMRVAAGLTIVGHEVTLVFMNRSLTEDEAECEHAELLELCDIKPLTTVVEMQNHFTLLDDNTLAAQLNKADIIVNL